MRFTIREQTFDLSEVARLYPAAMVRTGMGDEETQISLEWVDTLADDAVEIARYAIFIHSTDNAVSSFFYETREALEIALEDLSNQLA
jgi:hypothetical protein